MSRPPEPLVSIVCITFQHVHMLERAMHSFLQQRTDFPFEIVFHDDASTDGTAELIRGYAQEHPHLVRPILQTENQFKKGVKNTWVAVEHARGRYIAMCEGDDHWVDPLKLQKQVDAMRADPAAAGCFTDAWNERDGERSSYFDGSYAKAPAPRVSQREVALGQNIPACTFLFERAHLFPFPAQLKRAPVGDIVLYTHVARKGHLIHLPVHTAVRVIHAGGMYSMKSDLHKTDVRVRLLPILDEVTDGRYHAELERKRVGQLLYGWHLAQGLGDPVQLKKWWRIVARDPASGWNTTTRWRNWLKAWMPALERLYGRSRGA